MAFRTSPAKGTLSLLGCLALSSACTVGPRTPVVIVDQADELPQRERTDPDKEQFDLPEAEAVSHPRSDERTDQQKAQATVPTKRIGLAEVTLGERPPWETLEALKAPAPEEETGRIPTTWSLQRTITVGEGYLHEAEFSADEKSVVTLSTQSGHVYHFDLAGKPLTKVLLPGFAQFDDASFTTMTEITERPQLVVARPTGTTLLDLESGKFDVIESVPPGNGVQHTGRPGLYGISHRKITPQSGTVLFQWVSGEVAAKLHCDNRPDDWVLTPDGRFLAISYYPANHVEVLDLREGKLVGTMELPQWGSAIAISPDGSLLAMGGEKLRVVRFPGGEVVAEDANYGNNIGEVRFTPQGDLLLASAFDGKARSYVLPKDLDAMTSLPRPQILAHLGQANVYALGLTKDGRMLVTSSGDKTLKIWKR